MDRHHDAAQLLLSARRDMTQRLNSLPTHVAPHDHEQAYLVQRAIMRELGEIGGWKVGSPIADWQRIDLSQEGVRVLVDGKEIKRRTGNPAGDMMRLLLWLANTGARWASGLRAGQIVTTGSWTAKDVIPAGSVARVEF